MRTRPRGWRLAALITVSILIMCTGAAVALALAILTLFQARRAYTAIATGIGRVLLRLWGVRLVVSPRDAYPAGQVVYVSNHPSTLDLFILVALGLPNTRFFLSGYLRWFGPLGVIAWLMGTFFTVPQDRPAERVRIFMRAERILRRTRESVYLSPEGGRIPGGAIGPFNKGAFHLATALGAPIVPLYFAIPPAVDPGMGYAIGSGTAVVHVKPPIDTRAWRTDEVGRRKEEVREMFVAWNHEARTEVRHAH